MAVKTIHTFKQLYEQIFAGSQMTRTIMVMKHNQMQFIFQSRSMMERMTLSCGIL